MHKIMETLPFSKLRDKLPDVMEIVEKNEPVVLTHHGEAKCVMLSKEAWNSMADLFHEYEDAEILDQRSKEMADGHFHTVEEAEAQFREAGLM